MNTRAERLMCPLILSTIFAWLVLLVKTNGFGLILESHSFGQRFGSNYLLISVGFIVIIVGGIKVWKWLEEHSKYFGEYID